MSQFITINKPLVLFRIEKCDLTEHRTVPEGSYAVELVPNPFNKRVEPWLKIVGQPWGNARPCWNAVSVEVPKISVFGSGIQIAAGGLALVCVCLSLLTFSPGPPKKPAPDVATMKTELFGLCSERANLTNHYSLVLSPAQKTYDNRRSDAIYGLDVYPHYVDCRKRLQSEILRRRGDLDSFISALNALDDQLYHTWHDWGVTNRTPTIARLKKERAKFVSGEVMQEQSRLCSNLQRQIGDETMVQPYLAFHESLEHEIADSEPALRDVARQNRDCADRAIQLNARINALDGQIAALEHPPSLLKRLAFWKAKTTNSYALH